MWKPSWSQPRRSPAELPEAESLLGQSLPGDRCVLLRTLLQQLQKLQTLVTNKIARPYKMAATQTGTCLMVGAAPQTGPQEGASSQAGSLGRWTDL